MRVGLILCCLLGVVFGGKAQTVKVACVGNSVTYGYLLPDREKDAYPSQLAVLLGEGYEVGNFGKSGATLLRKGHRPYMQQPEYQEALKFAADRVIIHLGLNDTDPRNWPNYRDEFIRDYLALIESFRQVNPDCQIWICRMTPITHMHRRFKSGTREWHDQIQQAIEQVVQNAGVGLIDLHEPLYRHPNLLPDALHPDAEGAAILAKTVYSSITGDYGGLKMPQIYGDDMVLQQGTELKISGMANAGEEVLVELGRQKRKGTTKADGKWSVVMKNVKAGGPYDLKITASSGKLHYKNVMIGEVWLCSGQSNMAFMVKQSKEAQELLNTAKEGGVRLFNMKPKAYTDAIAWDTLFLKALNHLDYFYPTSWELASSKAVADFSAVAYSFGKMLSDSLNVPIGLICNAVGGAPAEAFIDRQSIENHHQLVDLLYHWLQNDMIQDWVRGRAALNIQASTTKQQRHPYEPCYLYETAIRPLEEFSLRGCIWYQGESNAHNIELHETIFPVLVDSWRKNWGEQMPFYFVQLSSINRPSWPHFRDSQRRLSEKIEHCEMAVSSDLGDPIDVHPTRKKEIGERLARLALKNTYNYEWLIPAGPLFKKVEFKKGMAWVEFKHAKEMKTSDGKPFAGFELAGKDGIFYPAEAVVVGEQMKVYSPQVSQPCQVRYGWQPYSIGNLVNGEGLPASTFSSNK